VTTHDIERHCGLALGGRLSVAELCGLSEHFSHENFCNFLSRRGVNLRKVEILLLGDCPLAEYDPKDPWATGGRTGYTPAPVPRRVRPQQKSFDFGRLIRTVLVLVALLWMFNYAWQHYYLANR